MSQALNKASASLGITALVQVQAHGLPLAYHLLQLLLGAQRWWVVGGTLGVVLTVLYVPFMREMFLIAKLHLEDLALCLVAGLFSPLWFEVFKAVSARRSRQVSMPGAEYGRQGGAAKH